MKLLLDAHIFLCALSEPNRLSQKQVVAMEDPTNTVYVSSVMITEMVSRPRWVSWSWALIRLMQQREVALRCLIFQLKMPCY